MSETTATATAPAPASTAAQEDEARRDAAVVTVEAEYRPSPRYRHSTLSNGEVVSELIES